MKIDFREVVQAKWKIILYTGVTKDPLVKGLLDIFKEAGKTEPDHNLLVTMYSRFVSAFIPQAAEISEQGKNAWQNYILQLMLADENVFSLQAESNGFGKISAAVKKLALEDLHYLQLIASFSPEMMSDVLAECTGDKTTALLDLPGWEEIYLAGERVKDKKEQELFAAFHGNEDWRSGLERLCLYYRDKGVGLFGKYHTFRWVCKNDLGRLVGVDNTDPILLSQLYEYEREQTKVIQNTEQFLAGYPANNVLLYGDRGTGKSSTIKALINKFHSRGLRLIEIQKQDLADFPQVISLLAKRPQRFILFIDDLSFNENEGEYREMKALLEGGVESRPQNVLVYATSNRRHLVSEKLSDRDYTGVLSGNEDLRSMDTLQEKLSLADRFGIAVTFSAPDQKRYLDIVEKLAQDRKLDIASEDLQQRAIKWELSFNARSARTARQFIDFLEGQLALEKKY